MSDKGRRKAWVDPTAPLSGMHQGVEVWTIIRNISLLCLVLYIAIHSEVFTSGSPHVENAQKSPLRLNPPRVPGGSTASVLKVLDLKDFVKFKRYIEESQDSFFQAMFEVTDEKKFGRLPLFFAGEDMEHVGHRLVINVVDFLTSPKLSREGVIYYTLKHDDGPARAGELSLKTKCFENCLDPQERRAAEQTRVSRERASNQQRDQPAEEAELRQYCAQFKCWKPGDPD